MRHPRITYGRKSQPPGYRYESDDYDQFQVIAVMEGKLHFESAAQQATLAPGDAVLLGRGSVFALFCTDIGYRGVFRATDEERPVFRVPAAAFPANPEVIRLAEMLHHETRVPREGSEEVMGGLAAALAWSVLRQSRGAVGREARPDYAAYWAGRARLALDAAVYTEQSAAEVLAALPLSYRQLARHFRAAVGLSPKEYQVRARMEEAKRLLRETRLPVTTVALELGYATSQHFAVQFRRRAGKSPTAFREEIAPQVEGALRQGTP